MVPEINLNIVPMVFWQNRRLKITCVAFRERWTTINIELQLGKKVNMWLLTYLQNMKTYCTHLASSINHCERNDLSSWETGSFKRSLIKLSVTCSEASRSGKKRNDLFRFIKRSLVFGFTREVTMVRVIPTPLGIFLFCKLLYIVLCSGRLILTQVGCRLV